MEINEKCLIDKCENYAVTRGVCMSCRVSLSKASKKGSIKKEQLDKILLPHKRKRRKNKTMDWLLSRFPALDPVEVLTPTPSTENKDLTPISVQEQEKEVQSSSQVPFTFIDSNQSESSALKS
ncbi:MAG TPA: hypothetical protein PLJ37_00865 [Chitinophagales bacterium]|nr:hypothetical protein [Chitinophagales bacterium]HMW93503.1 hypothetical protein [Chitinophagales bacterium]HMZ92999.1 hypothetical protein [Chitinophagales bacterium]HNG25937.1 hypothetical protein [Chitinophagales bacterium]